MDKPKISLFVGGKTVPVKFKTKITGRLKETLDGIVRKMPLIDIQEAIATFAGDSGEDLNNAKIIDLMKNNNIPLTDYLKYSKGDYVPSNQAEIDACYYEYFHNIIEPVAGEIKELKEFDIEFWKDQDYLMVKQGVDYFRSENSI